MAKAKTKNAKTEATLAVSAKSKAKKPVAKAASKADKLVTNIVDVETKKTTTLKDGVITMTKATEKKAEKVKAETVETAKNFFAGVTAKATEAAEKSRKLASDAGNMTRANLEAVTESGKIAAKGTQELAKENVEYAKTNFTEAQAAVKTLTAVKSPTEFVKVQSEIARKGFDTMVSQGSKNTETMIKLAGDMFQPLSNRMAVAKDFFKKAA